MHILVLVTISIPLSITFFYFLTHTAGIKVNLYPSPLQHTHSRPTIFPPFTYTYITNYRYSESDSDAGLSAL